MQAHRKIKAAFFAALRQNDSLVSDVQYKNLYAEIGQSCFVSALETLRLAGADTTKLQEMLKDEQTSTSNPSKAYGSNDS